MFCINFLLFFFFFFSSRRRHTRFDCDWSSDVCSSDLLGWRNSEWTGIAPVLEEDVAFSSIAQNEIGHARAIYQLLAEDADALAFDRKPEEYRCSPFVEKRFVP